MPSPADDDFDLMNYQNPSGRYYENCSEENFDRSSHTQEMYPAKVDHQPTLHVVEDLSVYCLLLFGKGAFFHRLCRNSEQAHHRSHFLLIVQNVSSQLKLAKEI